MGLRDDFAEGRVRITAGRALLKRATTAQTSSGIIVTQREADWWVCIIPGHGSMLQERDLCLLRPGADMAMVDHDLAIVHPDELIGLLRGEDIVALPGQIILEMHDRQTVGSLELVQDGLDDFGTVLYDGSESIAVGTKVWVAPNARMAILRQPQGLRALVQADDLALAEAGAPPH